MKLTLRNLWIILAVLSLPTGGLQASESNATVLNSKELAEIKGGWCIFEICEGAPGTGICQPVPANQAALCALTTCKYSQEEAGNIEIFSCNFKGPYTCSNNRAYRQCILAFKLSACGNGPDVLFCGVIVEPTCTLVAKERTCICAAEITVTPCDWTNCQ